MLDIVQWIVEIAALDVRRMSPLALCLSILVYGGLGLLFTVGAAIGLLQGETLGLVVVFLLGAAALARLAYGLFYRWRGAGTDIDDESR